MNKVDEIFDLGNYAVELSKVSRDKYLVIICLDTPTDRRMKIPIVSYYGIDLNSAIGKALDYLQGKEREKS